MRRFWRFLLRKSLPPGSLAATRYAVFGLGDSAYVKFNVRGQGLGCFAASAVVFARSLLHAGAMGRRPGTAALTRRALPRCGCSRRPRSWTDG
jgi:hypothetical protein